MKTIFTVGNEQGSGDTLLLEIGPDYCCYAFFDPAAGAFNFIRYLSFSETEDSFEELLNEWTTTPREVVICSGATQALLVPQKYYKPQPSLTAAIYDLDHYHELSDRIPEWQIVNTYALPRSLYEQLSRKFPDARYFHAYTPALKVGSGSDAQQQVSLHFSTTHFRVLVKKEGQVVLAQTYGYKAPLDVVYFLLKICYEFGLDQSEVLVIVSGLVERDSALYDELHYYFLNLQLAPAPSYALPQSDHPSYYFTSLYNLAACVS